MTHTKWRRICRELTEQLEALRAELASFELAWPEARREDERARYHREAQDLQRRTEQAQRRLNHHLERGIHSIHSVEVC